MRIVGMDIHRVAAEVVVLNEGKFVRLGRIPMLREKLEAFARTHLSPDDHVVIEGTDITRPSDRTWKQKPECSKRGGEGRSSAWL